MRFTDVLAIALGQIRANKLRSFFTLLGIIVSVAFLVAVVAIIQGMNAYVRENIAGAVVGANSFQVRRTPLQLAPVSDNENGPHSPATPDQPARRRSGHRRAAGGDGHQHPVRLAHAAGGRRVARQDAGRRADLRRDTVVPGGTGLPDRRRTPADRRRHRSAATRDRRGRRDRDQAVRQRRSGRTRRSDPWRAAHHRRRDPAEGTRARAIVRRVRADAAAPFRDALWSAQHDDHLGRR